jgi:hypothetical protein
MANRSAVWADKKQWTLAIRDIDFALDMGYPVDLKYKVLERKAQCLFSKGGDDNVQEAKRCIAEAVLVLQESKLKGAKLKAKERQLINMGQLLKPEPDVETGWQSPLLPVLAEPHPNFPTFSSCVAVRYEKGRGRFCVASRNVEVGELIAVETPHVAMLDKAEARSLCWHCFRSLLAPVPCSKCSGVLFCGPKCKYLYNCCFRNI